MKVAPSFYLPSSGGTAACGGIGGTKASLSPGQILLKISLLSISLFKTIHQGRLRNPCFLQIYIKNSRVKTTLLGYNTLLSSTKLQPFPIVIMSFCLVLSHWSVKVTLTPCETFSFHKNRKKSLLSLKFFNLPTKCFLQPPQPRNSNHDVCFNIFVTCIHVTSRLDRQFYWMNRT